MIDEVVALENITLPKIWGYVLKSFKLVHIVILVLSLGLIALGESFDFFALFTVWFIYVAGILFSVVIHEYTHLWWMKKLTRHKQVRIVITKATFSIKPLEKIKGTKSIIIACTGPLSCMLLGTLFLLVRAYWREHNILLLLLGISYGNHLLCFWPFSGDGLMIVKGVMDLLKGKLEDSISNIPDSYRIALGWVILAVVAMVLVAFAQERCRQSGWRAYGGSWRHANGQGHFNIGCTR